MSVVAPAFGLVPIVEGPALALAPWRVKEVLRLIADIARDQRRMIGLAVLAAASLLAWYRRPGF